MHCFRIEIDGRFRLEVLSEEFGDGVVDIALRRPVLLTASYHSNFRQQLDEMRVWIQTLSMHWKLDRMTNLVKYQTVFSSNWKRTLHRMHFAAFHGGELLGSNFRKYMDYSEKTFSKIFPNFAKW